MVSEKIRVATKLGLDATDVMRAIWWPAISSPPPGHPMFAAAEVTHTRTNGECATVAHRTRFVAVMLEELQRSHAAQLRRAAESRIRRAMLAEANLGEVDASAAFRPVLPAKGSPGILAVWFWRQPIDRGRRSALGLHSARNETAQFAGIRPGPLLQLGGAQGGLLPLLGREHILRFKLEAMATAEG